MNFSINAWDTFPEKGGSFVLSRNNRIFVNSFNESNLHKRHYYAMGKFFIFIYMDRHTGLKFLYQAEEPQKQMENIERVIKIQKIFHREGCSFDCRNEIIYVNIKDLVTERKRRFYGYRTSIDLDVKKMEQMGFFNITDWYQKGGHITKKYPDRTGKNAINRVLEAMKNHGIHRRRQIGSELGKLNNYAVTRNGDLKFIDIDHRMYIKEDEKRA